MKKKNNELNVDFIGGQENLTKEEEALISNFLKASKENKKKLKLTKVGKQKSQTPAY